VMPFRNGCAARMEIMFYMTTQLALTAATSAFNEALASPKSIRVLSL
jgi:hypothetical protein